MMAAVAMRLRAEMRVGWRAVAALVLIAGVFGGVVLGAFAAGRRTDSVVARQETALNEAHVYLPMFEGGPVAPMTPEMARSAPQTEAAIVVHEVRVAGDVGVVGSLDPRLGTTHGRLNMLRGRAADPSSPEEVVMNPLAAARLGVEMGERIDITFPPPGAPSEAGSFSFAPDTSSGGAPRSASFRVVGVGASLGDLVAAAEPHVIVTPAFLRQHGDLGQDRFMMVWLHRGDADLAAFRSALSAQVGGQAVFMIDARINRGQASRAFHMQAVALWLLSAAVAIATLLVFGQTLARHIFLESSEYHALSALGFSRRQLVALGLGRAAIAATGGALVAGIIGLISSAWTPFGLARVAEPHRGMRFDPVAVAGGAGAIWVAVVLVALLPAVRAATRTSARAAAVAPGGSRLAALVSRALGRPAPAVGARMALETGGGSTAVPVRSTFGGLAFGLAAFAAALTVASSMTHLEQSPRLYGWNWDAQVGGEEGDVRTTIGDIPGLEAYAVGAEFVPLEIGDRTVVAISMHDASGSVQPTMLQGAAPRAPDEIALGRTIARRAGAKIGDRIAVSVQGTNRPTQMQVTGLAVFPRVDDGTTVGEGAFITLDGMYALYPPAPPPSNAFVRFAPGRRGEALAALRKVYGADNVDLAEPPSSVLDFGRVANMPAILAGVLGLLAAGTLAHGLVTTVRRRRRDLAILKCLGFVRRQVRSAVVWNATTLVVLSMVVAIPAGIAAGRWLWTVIASGGGFLVESRAPFGGLTIAVPATLVLANIIASIPARSAARTQPSVVLRSE